MYPIEGTSFRSGNLRADTILKGGGIIPQCDILAYSSLWLNAWLDEDITIFLTTACATDMRLRETRYELWHWGPAGIGGHPTVRSWLAHSEGH